MIPVNVIVGDITPMTGSVILNLVQHDGGSGGDGRILRLLRF
jgi:hypothetical protein